MRTDSVKKYVIPNIPYLFIGWACLKLGTAYRLAPGVDLPHKLMGLGQTIGPAFADFAPGLDPLDWLIGIVGAVGFRLLIYAKSKKAKKYRRDEEYGSARWGGPIVGIAVIGKNNAVERTISAGIQQLFHIPKLINTTDTV